MRSTQSFLERVMNNNTSNNNSNNYQRETSETRMNLALRENSSNSRRRGGEGADQNGTDSRSIGNRRIGSL